MYSAWQMSRANIDAKTWEFQPNDAAVYYPSGKNTETNNMFTKKGLPIAKYTTTWELCNITRLLHPTQPSSCSTALVHMFASICYLVGTVSNMDCKRIVKKITPFSPTLKKKQEIIHNKTRWAKYICLLNYFSTPHLQTRLYSPSSHVSSVCLLTIVCCAHLIVANTGHSTRTHPQRRMHRRSPSPCSFLSSVVGSSPSLSWFLILIPYS